jgi:hypothetical protein
LVKNWVLILSFFPYFRLLRVFRAIRLIRIVEAGRELFLFAKFVKVAWHAGDLQRELWKIKGKVFGLWPRGNRMPASFNKKNRCVEESPP